MTVRQKNSISRKLVIEMRPGGGKSKGGSFERYCCKTLSLWVTKGKQEDVFWRSAMSGGRSTVAFKRGGRLAGQAGDISSISQAGHILVDHFVIEAKAYKNFQIEGLIKGVGSLYNFWKQVRQEAKTYDKKPMLIGKQNHLAVFVCLDGAGLKALGVKPTAMDMNIPPCDLNLVFFSDFVKLDPDKLKPQERENEQRVRR